MNIKETLTPELAKELKADWLKLQNYKGILLASATARLCTKYGMDISKLTEKKIEKLAIIEPINTEIEKRPRSPRKEKEIFKYTPIIKLKIGMRYRNRTTNKIYQVKGVKTDGKKIEIEVEDENRKLLRLKSPKDLSKKVVVL
jgi:hypothetical protein